MRRRFFQGFARRSDEDTDESVDRRRSSSSTKEGRSSRLLAIGLAILAIVLGILALSLFLPNQSDLNGRLRAALLCAMDGSCLGGDVRFTSLIVDGNVTAPNVPNGTCIESINGISAPNIDLVAGVNIVITPDPGASAVDVATTTDLVNITMLAVTQDTLLGNHTSCAAPLLPSCLDISGQMCMTPLDASCWPANATFDTLYVRTLILENDTLSVQTCDLGTSIEVDVLTANDVMLNGTMTCTNPAQGVSNDCLHLGGYSCPMGMPLDDSCIPASLTFYDLSVTNQLNLNLVSCVSPLDTACFPALVGDVTGALSSTTVVALQGVPVAAGTPLPDAILYYNGAQWTGASVIYSVPSVGNSVVARDADGNITVNVMNAQLLQPPIGSTQCVGLGAPTAAVGACAKADISLDNHDILNVGAIYVDDLFGVGAFNFPNIAMHANLNMQNNSLWFNNDLGTRIYSPAAGVLQVDAAFTVNNFVTATHYNGYNPSGAPTAVAGTGAGTGPTVTVSAGSTDCKLQVTVLTGTAPTAAATVFTLTYATPWAGTLTSGAVFSPASATAAALTGTAAPWISAETLSSFTFRSGAVALAATTTYVWNFQTCA